MAGNQRDVHGRRGLRSAQPAPRLDRVGASLYPFVREGGLDVSGGHHDAGDYGKYTINSAQMIHHLVFAADAFPGAGELDNLAPAPEHKKVRIEIQIQEKED